MVWNNRTVLKRRVPNKIIEPEIVNLLSWAFISYLSLMHISDLPDATNKELDDKLEYLFGEQKIDATNLLKKLRIDNVLTVQSKEEYFQELRQLL